MKHKTSQILTKREALLAKVLMGCTIYPLSILPLSFRCFLGRQIGVAFSYFETRDRLITELQIKWILPQISPKEILPKIFGNIGSNIFEALNLKPIINNMDRYIECPNAEIPKTINKRGRPVVALTAHMGNWELMAAYMVKVGVPLTTVGRQARNRFGQYLLSHLRARYGVNTMWKENRSGLREMVKHLSPGHTIAALIDQDTHVRSENIPFMGHLAKTPVGLIDIGKRFNAIFVTSFIVKDGDKHVIHVEEIPDTADQAEILEIYNTRLEELIRRYPDQWIWMHKRWRSCVAEKPLSSKEYIQFLKEQTNYGE
jgi:KDO2-lipid IV(A) lauroyltransferase